MNNPYARSFPVNYREQSELEGIYIYIYEGQWHLLVYSFTTLNKKAKHLILVEVNLSRVDLHVYIAEIFSIYR